MPWRTQGLMEARLEFVTRVDAGEKIAPLCREYGVSRDTGHRWIRRWKASGGSVKSLFDQSRRPHSSPNQTAPEIEAKVIKLRLKHGWGGRKLSHTLRRDQGICVPEITVNRIIKRNDLLELEDCHYPALKRFQRDEPNELWQSDIKGPMQSSGGDCAPLSILDDNSRFLTGLHHLKDHSTERVKGAYEATFAEFGIPDEMLFDHGTPWWGTSNESGLTRLSVWLMKQDIKITYGGFNHPETQGKVERFHRTLEHAVRTKGRPADPAGWAPLLAEIRDEYNYFRPHEALNMDVPAAHYRKSRRQFNPAPVHWQYQEEEGSIVEVGSLGRLQYQNRRYFVSEALVGEQVQVQQYGRKLLVSFRSMYVREIDLPTGATTAVVAPVGTLKV